MKKHVVLNLIAPLCTAVAFIATTRWGEAYFLAFMSLAIVSLGLVIVSLVAPIVLWRRHGVASLLAPLSAAVSIGVSLLVAQVGSSLLLRSSPVRPDTYLRGGRLEELTRLSRVLLETPRAVVPLRRLGAMGFSEVDVDTTRRVVRLVHLQMRTRSTYYFAPEGLPGAFSRPRRLDSRDLYDWQEFRRIAHRAYVDPPDDRGRSGSDADMAVRVIRGGLGDSLLIRTARRPYGADVPPEDRKRVRLALNDLLQYDSGFLADTAITLEGQRPVLRIEGRAVPDTHWVAVLLGQLLDEGAIRRHADGRHLMAADSLVGARRARVEWLQLGLMQFVFGPLIRVEEYAYDRRIREHWYYRRD